MSGSGHAQGTTQSAVSEGSITVRDKANSQDTGGLQRDVTQANDAISPIFNKEKEQKRLQIAQMTGDIAGQMTSMVMTEGNISALKAARAVPGNANLSAEELKQTRAYQDAFRDYGTGGKYQQIAQSASAAIAGLVNGDFSGAVAGAAAPFIATFVKKHTDEDSAQRILAHALAGAVIAKAQGKDALAGAAGASTGELTAKLALDLYGKKPEQLGESERQLVSSLSSVAAGLAGAAVSDNTAGVQTAAQAGKNAVENNSLSLVLRGGKLAVEGCAKMAACRNALIEKGLGALLGIGASKTVLDSLSLEDQQYILAVAVSGQANLIEKLTPEQRAAYDYLVEQDKQGPFSLLPPQQSASDDKPSSAPNLGNKLTDEHKKELGGTGAGTPGGWEPQDEENARNNERQTITVEDLTSTSSKGHETTGRSKLFNRTGGMNSANNEFDALSPSEIKSIPGGRVGKLADGRTVIVRERSTDGRPTLEIQSGKNRIKFRYDE
ncbi:VENN motif pre-toxin domain-containing protein [Cronobacter muytjensii]|uniref:VENN motif pre-toxin domain-containing protein n=1 Tax=Cronobacter muytjensii TaxID=413501 RepID=UPI0024A8AF5C|nr:VENN motif pre-toxin domain-containing protein [Cronobacter muytjensii]MDI6457935.1 VENN motif pre-toxin domain-containing protein [Cronobacter muytjensii]